MYKRPFRKKYVLIIYIGIMQKKKIPSVQGKFIILRYHTH